MATAADAISRGLRVRVLTGLTAAVAPAAAEATLARLKAAGAELSAQPSSGSDS
jgi:nicotinamidase/pyrazinamidase